MAGTRHHLEAIEEEREEEVIVLHQSEATEDPPETLGE